MQIQTLPGPPTPFSVQIARLFSVQRVKSAVSLMAFVRGYPAGHPRSKSPFASDKTVPLDGFWRVLRAAANRSEAAFRLSGLNEGFFRRSLRAIRVWTSPQCRTASG